MSAVRKAIRPDRPKALLRDANRRRKKVRRGYCRQNLHLLRGDNVYTRPSGRRYCRACYETARRQRRADAKTLLGYRHRKCAVRGCPAHTERAAMDPRPYYCPRHRSALAEAA